MFLTENAPIGDVARGQRDVQWFPLDLDSYRYYRDAIQLNGELQAFLTEKLKGDPLFPKKGDPLFPKKGDPLITKIVLAAREMSLAPGFTFTLPDCDLVLWAEKFDASEGELRLDVTKIAPLGQPGLPGRKLTLICREYGGINVRLAGGTGGQGLQGAPGAPGKDGRPSATGKNGGDGGKGRTGGTGLPGGKGGSFSLIFVTATKPGAVDAITKVDVGGGAGGLGGNGGPGGPGGEGVEWCKPDGSFCVQGRDGKKGPPGDRGPKGPFGPAGIRTLNKVSEPNFWKAVATLNPTWASEWGSYRLALGTYYFRALNVVRKDVKTPVPRALEEFNATLSLDSNNSLARTYRDYVRNGHNALGLPRNIDIIPDFERYEDVYTQYHPIVSGGFKAATDLLRLDVDLDHKKQTLQREIASLEGLVHALDLDIKAATEEMAAAVTQVDHAMQRVEEITQEIQEKREKLEESSVDVLGIILGTVGAVVAAIAAIPTAGASVVAAAGAVVAFGTAAATAAGNISTIVDELSKPSNERSTLNDLIEKAGGLKEAVAGAVDKIISFVKMLEDIGNANITNADEEAVAEYKKLIADSIELKFQEIMAKFRKSQAEYALAAAQQRYDQANQDKAAAQKQLQLLSQDTKILEAGAFTLLKVAQHYMDVLIKYAFFAARALEIETLADLGPELHYDYGYVHPNLMEDYKVGKLPLTGLITAYETSWSRFGDLIFYRDRYDKHFEGNWSHDYYRLSFKADGLLADFRATRRLRFTVLPGDLPKAHLESKVVKVYAALVGAKADAGLVPAYIEHSGRFSELLEEGQHQRQIDMVLKPRVAILQAATAPLAQQAGEATENPGFRRRGVAAGWQLYLDPAQTGDVDLSDLNEIQVWIYYETLIPQKVASQGLPFLQDRVLIRNDESGEVFITAGGARFPLPGDGARVALSLRAPSSEDEVPDSDLSLLPSVPRDNTLVRETSSDQVYVVKRGAKFLIPNDAVFDSCGFHRSEINVLPDNALDGLPYGGILEDAVSPVLTLVA